MITPVWINRGDKQWPLDLAAAERHYKATYIGDFCLTFTDHHNNLYHTEQAYCVFWNESPAKPEYSHYFGLHIRSGQTYIVNAISAATHYWDGIVADDGEVIYSRFRHDYRASTDGSVVVDGGRDYFKTMGKIQNPGVRLSLVRDQIVVNDCLYLPYAKP